MSAEGLGPQQMARIEELVQEIETLPDAARYTLRGPVVTADAAHGASIAVNGVCLTVTDETGSAALKDGEFTADVMAESLNRSSLADLRPGDRVNLERPMVANGRFGGHIVQGHVDGTGTVLERTPGEHWELVRVSLLGEPAPSVAEAARANVTAYEGICRAAFAKPAVDTVLEALARSKGASE